MKHANNPLNLHIGDRVTLKGNGELFYGVTGFTDVGFPIVENNWLVLRGIYSDLVEAVIRKEGEK